MAEADTIVGAMATTGAFATTLGAAALTGVTSLGSAISSVTIDPLVGLAAKDPILAAGMDSIGVARDALAASYAAELVSNVWNRPTLAETESDIRAGRTEAEGSAWRAGMRANARNLASHIYASAHGRGALAAMAIGEYAAVKASGMEYSPWEAVSSKAKKSEEDAAASKSDATALFGKVTRGWFSNTVSFDTD